MAFLRPSPLQKLLALSLLLSTTCVCLAAASSNSSAEAPTVKTAPATNTGALVGTAATAPTTVGTTPGSSSLSSLAPAPAPAPDPLMGNPVVVDWFQAHGWLMFLAFGVFMPAGIMAACFLQSITTYWFYLHLAAQFLTILTIVPGFAIGVSLFDALYDSTHARLGIALFSMVVFQPVWAFVRPHKGTHFRMVWYFVHWMFGMVALVLGWIDCYLGIQLYEEIWAANIVGLRTWFSVIIALWGFSYLVLSRWSHILSQSEPVVDSNDEKVAQMPGHVHGV